MLQWLYMHVASICFKCFSYFSDICFKCFICMLHNIHVASVCFKHFRCLIRMLQLFYLDVAKLDLDVACVCNDFQVFSCVLQVF
jgi:hypothetical protein